MVNHYNNQIIYITLISQLLLNIVICSIYNHKNEPNITLGNKFNKARLIEIFVENVNCRALMTSHNFRTIWCNIKKMYAKHIQDIIYTLL